MLLVKPSALATSGVFVSWRPRSTPVVARTTSIAGMRDGADPQVGDGVAERLGRGTEETADRTGEDRDEHRGDGAQADGEPCAVDAGGDRAVAVAGPELARHDRRRAVGEEDEDVGGGEQHRARDTQAGELRGAEVTDDRGVGEEEERLGDEGQEGREGQPQDLTVLAGGLLRGLAHTATLVESSGREGDPEGRRGERAGGRADDEDLRRRRLEAGGGEEPTDPTQPGARVEEDPGR